MRSLARYTLANAVSRAMRSEFLAPQDFDDLARAASFSDLWAALEKTSYGHWLARPAAHDAREIERQLHQATALRFRRALRTLRGKPLDVAALLLSRWDLDALAIVLRRWHGRGHDVPEAASSLYPTFADILPFRRILEADTLAEVAAALNHTPYAAPILSQARHYHDKRSIAVVETALERDFYRRLLDAVRALGGRDAQEAEAILTVEIGLLNLSILGRQLRYGHGDSEDAADVLIPGPSQLSRRLARPGADFDTVGDAFAGPLTSLGARLPKGPPTLQTLTLIERVTDEMGVNLARKALAGFPFRFTCVLALYTFKRLELKNLRAVFAAKTAGLDAEATLARLHGLN